MDSDNPAPPPGPLSTPLPPPAPPASGARRRARGAAAALALGAILFTVGAVGLTPVGSEVSPAAERVAAGPARGSTEALRDRARMLPKDAGAWSALGMAYVQEARGTADPSAHRRAEQALRRSLAVQPADNAGAHTGLGALAAARHDFAQALLHARTATRDDPYAPAGYGVLADAYTQLGRYEESYRAVQRMNDLRPDAAALARASYTFELRGETDRASDLMRRSLAVAATPAERAFAYTCLSQLALQSGNPRGALDLAARALRSAPADSALLEARARARTALGDLRGAVRDYEAAIALAPLPHYLLGLGELQQSLGRSDEAAAQYAVLRAQETVRQAEKGPADTDAILFEADHGSSGRAVAMARETARDRPFVAVHDAQAWALYRAGRHTEALREADLALALGTRSALFHYHRAAIRHALGQDREARADLVVALRTEPRFHPLHAAAARALLQRIDTTP